MAVLDYELKYAKAHQLSGYATPAEVLSAAALFDMEIGNLTHSVHLSYVAETGTYGAIVLWEDYA